MSIPFNVNEKVCNNRSGIYAIVNIVTRKFYIGSAVKLINRKNHHLSDLRKGKHHSKYLQRSYNKHGEDVFVFKIIEYVEKRKDLLKIEQKYLDIYYYTGVTYNISPTAGSCLGIKHSDETKKKMSLTKKNMSEETKKKLSDVGKGRIHSEKSKKKMSEVQKGKKQSEETIKKMLEARRKPIIQLTKNNEFVAKFNSMIEAERETRIDYSSIGKCCSGKRKSAGGYFWQYLE